MVPMKNHHEPTFRSATQVVPLSEAGQWTFLSYELARWPGTDLDAERFEKSWKIIFFYIHMYTMYTIYIYTYVRFIVQIVFSIIIYIYYHILSIFSRGMDQTTLVMPRIKTRNKWYGIATIMNISDILSSDINNKWI